MYVAPESNVLFGLAAVAETSAPVVTTTKFVPVDDGTEEDEF